MKMLPVLVAVISFFEIRAMWTKGLKKEIAVFAVIAAITLVYGYYYLLNTDSASLVRSIFDLLGI